GQADAPLPKTVAGWVEAITNADIPANLKKQLLAVVGSAATGVGAVEDRIASWFDDTMDRLGGAYKRYQQQIAFVFAMLLVWGTNADTLMLAKRFWSDPVARQAQIALAQKAPESCKTDDNGRFSCGEESSINRLPIGWSQADWRQARASALETTLKILGL